jgi:hypothetical protein
VSVIHHHLNPLQSNMAVAQNIFIYDLTVLFSRLCSVMIG